jgi:hypothetical protein
MVGLTSSNAGALLLLAQDGVQPAADETVEDAEQTWRGVFEVAKPPRSIGLRSLMIRARLSPRLRLVMLLTLSLSAFRLFLRTSRRPTSNR